MRRIVIVGALLISWVQLQSAQRPPDNLYHGPLLLSREAQFIEPKTGVPIAFSNSTLHFGWRLRTTPRSNSLHSIGPAGITLRTAFGPTADGLITFRMVFSAPGFDQRRPIVPSQPPAPVQFVIAPDEIDPGPLALKPQMKVVFTVERVERESGALLFENPDATELLWEALGRPAPTSVQH